ncbi:hypothetical protein [Pseudoalteromonas sp. MMG022]|uniref:hypothetical protein n=1 Tax=Pseudoalteromonas sp. MMG022 TaxID=2909978 RepID=UPI001F47EE6E|nr:hypothetical protein [Pseudoalteromonas sp. MMG022]MCF6436006.1 hypothetical protein [Pseudoalteromonas sp. MMG022]
MNFLKFSSVALAVSVAFNGGVQAETETSNIENDSNYQQPHSELLEINGWASKNSGFYANYETGISPPQA